MSVQRAIQMALVVAGTALWMSCGQYYRPVVIPIGSTSPTPANFHTVFAVNANAPLNPGTGMQIDVSGDTKSAVANVGLNPTHAAIQPSNSRVFVTNAGSLNPGGADSVSTFGSSIGIGTPPVFTFSLPAGSLPVFVTTTQNVAAYVANFGTNSVTALNTSINILGNTTAVGTGPVALAETPDATKVYVASLDGTVTDLSTVDLSPTTVIPVGTSPVWLVARVDSQKIYAVTQGSGQLVTIDTATDLISSVISVGAGANFIAYDPNLNRLYVTNPATATVYVFAATGGPNDTPLQLAAISMTAGANAPCPATGCSPVAVSALPDGSRFYIASYQLASPCPDSTVSATSCVIPKLTVVDAKSFTIKKSTFLLMQPQFAANQYAVPAAASCAMTAPYAPSSMRFRVFSTASADSSRVYVSMCDAGAIAIVDTTDSNINNPGGGSPPTDTLIADLITPFAICSGSCNGAPPPQSPIFLLRGL